MDFIWRAQYNDGTELLQIDGTSKNAYRDIDRSSLEVFQMYDSVFGYDSRPICSVVFDDDGELLFWTRRVFMHEHGTETIHLLGKRDRFIIALLPDGSTVLRNDFTDDGLFDKVV